VAQALRSHQKSEDAGESRPRQELIFVLVDIDRFKRVNDELGHAAGDHLLQEVAKRIASVMRRSDDLVRWGGEEFLLVCRTTDRENAGPLCTRVLEAVRDLPFDVGNGVQVHKTCSIGWAPFPWMHEDTGMLSLDNVIELADKALYLAKREGRNRSFGWWPRRAFRLRICGTARRSWCRSFSLFDREEICFHAQRVFECGNESASCANPSISFYTQHGSGVPCQRWRFALG